MADVTELKTSDDFDAMLAASQDGPVALLKHSIACPISARGQGEFVGLEEEDDPKMYAVVVQYARELSNTIAERLDVKHETPQALIIHKGNVVFKQNHYAIKTADLRDAARQAA